MQSHLLKSVQFKFYQLYDSFAKYSYKNDKIATLLLKINFSTSYDCSMKDSVSAAKNKNSCHKPYPGKCQMKVIQ